MPSRKWHRKESWPPPTTIQGAAREHPKPFLDSPAWPGSPFTRKESHTPNSEVWWDKPRPLTSHPVVKNLSSCRSRKGESEKERETIIVGGKWWLGIFSGAYFMNLSQEIFDSVDNLRMDEPYNFKIYSISHGADFFEQSIHALFKTAFSFFFYFF